MNTLASLLTVSFRRPNLRRGAVIPLVALFLVVFVAMAAFAIDVAYMQLVTTELRSATDAAAKAGTSALVQGKSDEQAIDAAIALARQNYVAGSPLQLRPSDISIGQSQLQPDGTWLFVPGARPSQAMQINSNLFSRNSSGSVPLFLGPLLGTQSFAPSQVSVASAFACEVCLCLDRSGSMKWDTSGTDWKYPPPYHKDWETGYERPPVNGSRWWALDRAVSRFVTILDDANAPPRVAVVTWASDVTTDLGLTSDLPLVGNAVHRYSSLNFQGGTNMTIGMRSGYNVLTSASTTTYAKKIMILMSDGEWNEGSDPEVYAANFVRDNITIHTISFLAGGAGTEVLRDIAAKTSGKFYSVTDEESLTAAWQDLAYSLPVVLTR